MDDVMVQRVRRFNRAVAQRVGALDDRFLARDRPMAAARLLWEIGREGSEVRALRSRLGLDSGHASRLPRALEADGAGPGGSGARGGGGGGGGAARPRAWGGGPASTAAGTPSRSRSSRPSARVSA